MTPVSCQQATIHRRTTGAFLTTRFSWTSSPTGTPQITITLGPRSNGIGEKRILGSAVIWLDSYPSWITCPAWASRPSSPLVLLGSICFGKQTVRHLVVTTFNPILTSLTLFFPIILIIADCVAVSWRPRADGCILLRLLIGYSALDFTTLDPHWGHRDEWRTMIDAVHARGMYYVVDFTVATMGDLIAWKG